MILLEQDLCQIDQSTDSTSNVAIPFHRYINTSIYFHNLSDGAKMLHHCSTINEICQYGFTKYIRLLENSTETMI